MSPVFYKIGVFLMAVFAAVLPFGPALPNIFSGLLIGYWLVGLLMGLWKVGKQEFLWFLVCNGFVLFHLLSLLWSEDLTSGLEKASSWLLIPVLFLAHSSFRKFFKPTDFARLLIVFTCSLCLLSIVSLIASVASHGISFETLSQNGLATAAIDFHYLGFSLYSAVALVLNLYLILYAPENFPAWYKKVLGGILIFLGLVLLLLGSRTTLAVAATLSLGILLAGRSRIQLSRAGKILIPLALVSLIGFVALNPILKDKFKEAINFEGRYDIEENWGGRGFRELIWNCALHVTTANPVIGVGLGDQKAELDYCYRQYRYQPLLVAGNNFNAHNVFLQALMTTGFIGLFLLFLAIGYPLLCSLKTGNTVYLLFILLFFGTGLTESHFNRNAMILLFSFFNPLIWFALRTYESTADS